MGAKAPIRSIIRLIRRSSSQFPDHRLVDPGSEIIDPGSLILGAKARLSDPGSSALGSLGVKLGTQILDRRLSNL